MPANDPGNPLYSFPVDPKLVLIVVALGFAAAFIGVRCAENAEKKHKTVRGGLGLQVCNTSITR